MKRVIETYPIEEYISAAKLECANLNEWELLELHLLDQATVEIPGEMIVLELVRTAGTLALDDLLATLNHGLREVLRLSGGATLQSDEE